MTRSQNVVTALARHAALLMALWLVGCDADRPAPAKLLDPAVVESDRLVVTAVKPESLRLYVFNCGEIDFPSIENFGIQDHETEVRRLVVPCYILDHPNGRMLWDGGLPTALAQNEGWLVDDESKVRMRLQKSLSAQLAEMDLGFSLEEVDYAAFSHIHYDHVGVANELVNATWLVQRGDFDEVMKDKSTVPAFDPSLVSLLKARPAEVLDGDYDVFGDGVVQLIAAPGHTPGHQVLSLNLEETGPLVLSGDLYHFRLSRTDRRVPVFNVDGPQTLASMTKVEALVLESGATFWIEHDAALFNTLKQAPDFYR